MRAPRLRKGSAVTVAQGPFQGFSGFVSCINRGTAARIVEIEYLNDKARVCRFYVYASDVRVTLGKGELSCAS